jgi:hypothetical protein
VFRHVSVSYMGVLPRLSARAARSASIGLPQTTHLYFFTLTYCTTFYNVLPYLYNILPQGGSAARKHLRALSHEDRSPRMTTTHSPATVPNPDAVEALALTIMRSEILEDADYDNSESAADIAHTLVYYSKRAQRFIDCDQKRFPGVPNMDVGDYEHELNSIGDTWSFSLGFEFGLQWGERIATTPFTEIGASDLVSRASAEHLEQLEHVHKEHFREGRYTRPAEQDGAEAKKAEQKQALGLAQSAAGEFIDWGRAPLTDRERKVRAKILERLEKDARRSGFPGVQFREVGSGLATVIAHTPPMTAIISTKTFGKLGGEPIKLRRVRTNKSGTRS